MRFADCNTHYSFGIVALRTVRRVSHRRRWKQRRRRFGHAAAAGNRRRAAVNCNRNGSARRSARLPERHDACRFGIDGAVRRIFAGRASAKVQAAKGEWLQVGLMPNPVGGYSTAEIGEENTAGQEGGMIGQEIVLGGKLRLNRAVAAQEIRRAEQELQSQQWRVMNDVQIQFYEVLIAQRKVELAERLVGIGQQGVTASEQLFQAKEVSNADVLQSRIEANTARIIAENARNSHLAAWRTLAAVVGNPEMQPVILSGDARADLNDIQWAEAYQHIMTASPELAAARRG